MTAAEFSKLMKTAIRAEGRIGGGLRGGLIHNGEFHANGSGGQIFGGPVNTIADLKIHPDHVQREGRPDWQPPAA